MRPPLKDKATSCYELRELLDACPCAKCHLRKTKALPKPCVFGISNIMAAVGKDVPKTDPLSIDAVQR